MPEKFLTTLLEGSRVITSRALLLLFAPVLLLSIAQFTSALFESSGTPPHLQWARRLNPFDHKPHLLLAELEPNHANAHWEQIRTLHPLYAPAWIRLGLDHEMQGRKDDAERTLLHAATLDRTFLPQWTLANFYFRQGREDLFWTQTRRAVSVYQGDLTGVFQLSLRIEADPLRVWERLAPPHPPARMDLMRILLSSGRLNAAAIVANLVASAHLRHTREILLEACGQAIAGGDAASAVTFWNAAAANGWIARPVLDPAKGALLADGAFQHPSMGTCFDWRTPPQDGVTFRAGAPAGLRIVMNGRQAPRAVLASLYIPVEPRRRYRLTWRYTTELGHNSARPAWRINGAAAADWQPMMPNFEDAFEFDSGSRRLVELTLSTLPAPGTTRPEGRLRLDWVAITALTSSPAPPNHL